eukprot:gene21281-28203_t
MHQAPLSPILSPYLNPLGNGFEKNRLPGIGPSSPTDSFPKPIQSLRDTTATPTLGPSPPSATNMIPRRASTSTSTPSNRASWPVTSTPALSTPNQWPPSTAHSHGMRSKPQNPSQMLMEREILGTAEGGPPVIIDAFTQEMLEGPMAIRIMNKLKHIEGYILHTQEMRRSAAAVVVVTIVCWCESDPQQIDARARTRLAIQDREQLRAKSPVEKYDGQDGEERVQADMEGDGGMSRSKNKEEAHLSTFTTNHQPQVQADMEGDGGMSRSKNKEEAHLSTSTTNHQPQVQADIEGDGGMSRSKNKEAASNMEKLKGGLTQLESRMASLESAHVAAEAKMDKGSIKLTQIAQDVAEQLRDELEARIESSATELAELSSKVMALDRIDSSVAELAELSSKVMALDSMAASVEEQAEKGKEKTVGADEVEAVATRVAELEALTRDLVTKSEYLCGYHIMAASVEEQAEKGKEKTVGADEVEAVAARVAELEALTSDLVSKSEEMGAAVNSVAQRADTLEASHLSAAPSEISPEPAAAPSAVDATGAELSLQKVVDWVQTLEQSMASMGSNQEAADSVDVQQLKERVGAVEVQNINDLRNKVTDLVGVVVARLKALEEGSPMTGKDMRTSNSQLESPMAGVQATDVSLQALDAKVKELDSLLGSAAKMADLDVLRARVEAILGGQSLAHQATPTAVASQEAGQGGEEGASAPPAAPGQAVSIDVGMIQKLVVTFEEADVATNDRVSSLQSKVHSLLQVLVTSLLQVLVGRVKSLEAAGQGPPSSALSSDQAWAGGTEGMHPHIESKIMGLSQRLANLEGSMNGESFPTGLTGLARATAPAISAAEVEDLKHRLRALEENREAGGATGANPAADGATGANLAADGAASASTQEHAPLGGADARLPEGLLAALSERLQILEQESGGSSGQVSLMQSRVESLEAQLGSINAVHELVDRVAALEAKPTSSFDTNAMTAAGAAGGVPYLSAGLMSLENRLKGLEAGAKSAPASSASQTQDLEVVRRLQALKVVATSTPAAPQGQDPELLRRLQALEAAASSTPAASQGQDPEVLSRLQALEAAATSSPGATLDPELMNRLQALELKSDQLATRSSQSFSRNASMNELKPMIDDVEEYCNQRIETLQTKVTSVLQLMLGRVKTLEDKTVAL